uniref:BAH domain-containing protein n=1 Tax=Brassica oleracea var. oleracea TaxID=109376 RepID=A0A0D3CJU1_BRAOL
MLQPKSNRGEEHPDFKWGDKKAVGRTDKSVSFYESFTFEDIEYRLFDCAYFQIHGQCETSIGKLIRMYETSSGEKKVKVLWFFRPMDIRSYLRDYVPQWDELFLACGDDPGVYNINDVVRVSYLFFLIDDDMVTLYDTILGKCSVVCLSDDRRNPLPTRRELRIARYVFSRTFDTKRKIISEDFADAIAGIRVEKFFNQRIDKDPLKRPYSSADPVKSFRSESRLEKNYDRDGKLTCRTSPVKKEVWADRVHVKKYPPINTDITSRGLKTKTTPLGSPLGSGSSGDHKPSKRRKLVLNTPDSDCCPGPGEKKVTKNPPLVDKAPSQTSVSADITARGLHTKTTPLGRSPLGSVSSSDHKPSKRRNLVLNTPDSDYCPEPGEKKLTKNPPIVDKAPSQTIGRSSWYKRLNFEEELKRAIETERLVLFENLEPSYTSMEVENLCRQALKERVDAKMIPASLVSNPHIGRALVIFYTKKAADNAISRLTRECLMLDDQRPLVGSRDFPKEVGECGSFTGHQRLVDRALMSISKRKAVSTAHCTQPNHIVHELAVEWKALHAKSEGKWKWLLEEQAKEINIIFKRKNPKNVRG